jgi:hypothetical protein
VRRPGTTSVEFEVDVSSIPRVRGATYEDAGFGTSTPHVLVKVSANALDSAYVEVQLPMINGVIYHYGRLWAVLEGGAWQVDGTARPKLSSPWGRTLDDPTASAERSFAKVAELVLSKLAGLEELPAALQTAAVHAAENARTAALRDLGELEKRTAQARAQAQHAEDVLAALEEPLTPEQHRYLVSFLEAGHSYADAVEAAKVLS